MKVPQNPDDVVRVATALNPAQAHIWQQALEAEGIQSQVVGDYLDAGLGDIPGVTAELWVHRDDLARAEEVLRQGRQSGGGSADDESEE
jgi:hypothetical protein